MIAMLGNTHLWWLLLTMQIVFPLLASTLSAAANASGGYIQPNSTGIKLQNGFERVFIQVLTCFLRLMLDLNI